MIEQRRGIGPARVAIVLSAIVALAFAVTALTDDPAPRPLVLAAMTTGDQAVPPEQLDFEVRNTGDVDVDVIAAKVRGVDDAAMTARRVRIPAYGSGRIPIHVPARCPGMPSYRTIDVRIVVDGRKHWQTLNTESPVQTCP